MFTKLKNLVTSFNGDALASCFAENNVKEVRECNKTVMFQTECGKLFEVYKSILIKKY